MNGGTHIKFDWIGFDLITGFWENQRYCLKNVGFLVDPLDIMQRHCLTGGMRVENVGLKGDLLS